MNTLWDVIVSHPSSKKMPLGQAFTTEEAAKAYAEALRSRGFEAEEPFEIKATAYAEAILQAENHFADLPKKDARQ